VGVPIQFQEGQLVSSRRLIGPSGQRKPQFLVKANGLIQIAHPDTRMKKFNHETNLVC
jgi:hypothetical protein